MPQILLTTFFTSINFRLKNTKKYSILLNWHFLKFSILWNIYRCDIEFLACNVYIGNTIYYTYKVWTCIVYDWKHLEAITNQDGGGVKATGRWRRKTPKILRGGSGEKTVSKAQIVSPFPEERYTVHLKTSRLPVTARARQLLIRYTQNASYLFLRFHFIFRVFV